MPFKEEIGLDKLAKQERQFIWEVIKRTNTYITRRRVWNLKK